MVDLRNLHAKNRLPRSKTVTCRADTDTLTDKKKNQTDRDSENNDISNECYLVLVFISVSISGLIRNNERNQQSKISLK